MRLADVRREMVAHGVTLILTPEGEVKPRADHAPPAALIAGMKAHREALARQTREGRGADGRLNVAALAQRPGRCGCCARWTPDEYGDGLCSAGRAAHGWGDGNPHAPVITPPYHECAAHGGQGWKTRGAA